jgi:hypothetical protein
VRTKTGSRALVDPTPFRINLAKTEARFRAAVALVGELPTSRRRSAGQAITVRQTPRRSR